jgi:hypothetical protein
MEATKEMTSLSLFIILVFPPACRQAGFPRFPPCLP